MAAASLMKQWFPFAKAPLIISAPMAFVTNSKLATEVTKAGGFGFIQGGREFGVDATRELDASLNEARKLLGIEEGQPGDLPIGVGFLTFSDTASQFLQTTLPVLRRYRPAAIWLFAPRPEAPATHSDIIKAVRSASGDGWSPKVAVQVGTVAAARQALNDGADIVIAQGIDAGGHQFAQGASVVSLVPEVADVLAAEYKDQKIGLWAAGGIADGRGVAAAVSLGAEGVVIGSRFIPSPESDATAFKKASILATTDGASNTVKSQLHDHISGNMAWPEPYDGRAIITPTYVDQQAGVPLDTNQKRYKEATAAGDNSRVVNWSGTGVGLIKEALPAREVVSSVRQEALSVMQSALSRSKEE